MKSGFSQRQLLLRSHLDSGTHFIANSGRVTTSRERDAHHAMEINFVESGKITYLFGGNLVPLPERCMVLFWGIFPHQVVAWENNTLHHWMEIPLSLFLQWGLPGELIARLMSGNMVMDQGKLAECDGPMFRRWHKDLESPSNEICEIAALEVEARLRRLALSFSCVRKSTAANSPPGNKGLGALQKIGKMAAFIAEHYLEPLQLESVACEVNLRPDYATTLFKKVCGVSIIDYVIQHRISHAKRLLLTTDNKVLDIALDSGFGSASRFYEAFTRLCGQTPQQFRKLERETFDGHLEIQRFSSDQRFRKHHRKRQKRPADNPKPT